MISGFMLYNELDLPFVDIFEFFILGISRFKSTDLAERIRLV